jgi:hypothetical protein
MPHIGPAKNMLGNAFRVRQLAAALGFPVPGYPANKNWELETLNFKAAASCRTLKASPRKNH